MSVPEPSTDSQRGFVYRFPATNKRLIVPGEYEHVARGSGNTTLLREAHATPCTVLEARAMLAALAAKHSLPDLRARFGSSTRGHGGQVELYRRVKEPWQSYRRVLRAGRTTWEVRGFRWRREWVRDTEGRIVYVARVSLPKVPMELGGDWFGRLRVGLVLHEFAHAMVLDDGDHDRDFIGRLDRLLGDWAVGPGSRRARTQVRMGSLRAALHAREVPCTRSRDRRRPHRGALAHAPCGTITLQQFTHASTTGTGVPNRINVITPMAALA